MVFRAAADAKPDFRRIRLWGSATVTPPGGTAQEIRREAVPMQEIYIPGGGRTPFPVNTHLVSVTGPGDVLLKLSAPEVTLAPGGTATVEVEVVRHAGTGHATQIHANVEAVGTVLSLERRNYLLSKSKHGGGDRRREPGEVTGMKVGRDQCVAGVVGVEVQEREGMPATMQQQVVGISFLFR